MAALRGEWYFSSESSRLRSAETGACATAVSRGTNFFVVSAPGSVSLRIVVSVCADAANAAMTNTGSRINLRYAENLFNGHIHLVEQLIEFLQRIIIKGDLPAAVFAVFQFHFCTEMGSQFVFHF